MNEVNEAGTFDFSNQRTLIFGGASGIGRAAALELSSRGGAVAVADIDVDGAKDTVAEIESAGGQAVAIACDVTRDDSVRGAAAEAEQKLGDLDIVMNNVGVIISGNPEDIPLEEWRRVVELLLPRSGDDQCEQEYKKLVRKY